MSLIATIVYKSYGILSIYNTQYVIAKRLQMFWERVCAYVHSFL